MSRKKARYSLNPHAMRKPVRDYVDFDYLHKLSDKEAEWLNRFSNEFYHGFYSASGDNIHSPEQRKELYARNNRHNRDIFGIFDRQTASEHNMGNPEDKDGEE